MNNITGLNNFYIPNTLDGLNGIDSSISGSSLLLDGSNAMLSNLNVGTHKLINVVEPTVSSDGANKNYVDTAISSAGTSYLKLDGTTSMTGSLNINNNDIINIKMLKSVVGSDLTLQRGLSTVLQLTSSESIFSLPVVISSTLSALVGINLNNSKIINCYSLTGYANNNLIFNYLSGVNVLPKITLTSTTTQITDGLLINSGGIDMNNNDIINIKMLKSVVGSDLTLQRGISTVLQLTSSEAIFSLPVVISSTLSALVGINLNNSKIINCYSLTSYANNNLIFNYLSGVNVLPKITLTSTTTQITDGLLINSGGIDMNNNDIINIKMLKAVSGASLTLQIGNSNVLQLTPSQALFSLPLYLSLSLGAQGIDLNGTKILNCYSLTSYPNTNLIFNYLSGVNVLPKITLTATTTQITDGLLINSGGIDMNNNDIINIKMLKSVVGSDLILQRGTTTILQLTSSESIFSLPVVISSSLGLGTVGINMNSTKIINVYSLTSYANNNLIFNYLSGVNVLPKITLTSTTTQITDGLIINSGGINMNTYSITNCPILHAGTTISLRIATTTIMQIQALKVLMSMPIDMGGKLINVMANGVLSTDAATKGQMDTADLLKMDKANGVGTGQMTLTHTASSLKLVSTLSQGNLILQNPIGSLIDFWNGSGTPIASITSNNAGSYLNFSVGATIGTGLRITNTSINCNLPTNITGNLNISSGELNMNNNTITNTSNIHSFGTNPIYLTNNNVAKVKIDASGITMQNSGNINLLGNNILNVNYIDSNGTTPLYFANSGVSICQVDSSGFVMSSQKNINMNGSNINYLANSIASSDAVNRYEISNSLIPLANWRSGETIQTVLKGSELGQLKNNSSIGAGYIGGMTYPLSIFYSFSFTPKSPTSMIYATFDGSYNATGTNTNDMFKSFIGTTIAGTSTSRMLHDCLTGGFGLRGVSCFPIHACWNNTTTTAYTIGCYFDLQGSDDYLTFNTQFSVKIEEIKI